jgi:hypothetical protein
MKRFIGAMLFCVMALVAFGLFGVGDIKETPAMVIQNTSLDNGPSITAYQPIPYEEQMSMYEFSLGLIIGLLGLVYLGGIVYNEYETFRDIEKEPYNNEEVK